MKPIRFAVAVALLFALAACGGTKTAAPTAVSALFAGSSSTAAAVIAEPSTAHPFRPSPAAALASTPSAAVQATGPSAYPTPDGIAAESGATVVDGSPVNPAQAATRGAVRMYCPPSSVLAAATGVQLPAPSGSPDTGGVWRCQYGAADGSSKWEASIRVAPGSSVAAIQAGTGDEEDPVSGLGDAAFFDPVEHGFGGDLSVLVGSVQIDAAGFEPTFAGTDGPKRNLAQLEAVVRAYLAG